MSIALRGITKSFKGVTVIPPLTIEFSSRAFTLRSWVRQGAERLRSCE